MKQIFFIFLVAPLSVFCMEDRLTSNTENIFDTSQWDGLVNTCAQFSARGYRVSLDTFHELSDRDYIVYEKGYDTCTVEKPPLKEIHYIILLHSPELKPIDSMVTTNEEYLNTLDAQTKMIVFSILTIND